MHQYTLMRHLPTHTDERNFRCNQCGKAFRQMSTLSQHKATHSKVVSMCTAGEGNGLIRCTVNVFFVFLNLYLELSLSKLNHFLHTHFSKPDYTVYTLIKKTEIYMVDFIVHVVLVFVQSWINEVSKNCNYQVLCCDMFFSQGRTSVICVKRPSAECQHSSPTRRLTPRRSSTSVMSVAKLSTRKVNMLPKKS